MFLFLIGLDLTIPNSRIKILSLAHIKQKGGSFMMRLIGKSFLVSILIFFVYKNRFRLINLVLLFFMAQKGFQGSKWFPLIGRLLDINLLDVVKDRLSQVEETPSST